MRRRFFVDQFSGNKAFLEGDTAHHLGRVLRAERGQLFELSDGVAVFLARIENTGRHSIEFSLVEPIAVRASHLHSRLLLSIAKFDRFEWALEKATELGVAEIIPVAAERSEKGLIAAAEKRSERWRKILLESAQQARSLRPPALHTVQRAPEAFRGSGDAAIRLLLSERPGASPLRVVLQESESEIAAANAAATPVSAPGIRLALAIGPEGGWTEAEFAAAAASAFREAAIGANILRTETAVIAGLAAAHLWFDSVA